MTPGSKLRIVLAGDFLARYPEGGGHWTVFLQYLLGLAALGHDVFWLELFHGEDPDRDPSRIAAFFRRMTEYGFGERCAVLWHAPDLVAPALAATQAHGMSHARVAELARSADLLWNFACALRQPLLGLFRRRVLIDLDPGHLQVSALTVALDLHEHDAFLTVGANMHAADCEVPTLGVAWRRFTPFVHMPMWAATPDPGRDAPFSSITHWTWEELRLGERPLSVSKRAAYLEYLQLPARTRRPFELAAYIHAADASSDRDDLARHGWRLVDPHRVAGSPRAYRDYIMRSRAEFACPKPIHRALRTGWFSDRSAVYLASGRPVLMEDTGFTRTLPAGRGVVVYRDLDEAAAGVAAIDADYARHMRAARELAEAYLDARPCLERMLAASLGRRDAVREAVR